MAGLFGTFDIAKKGLSVSQSTINVTAHNITNANTEGYSRQRADIVTARPMTVVGSAGQVGTGAVVQAINRIRDTFIDYQYRNENSTLNRNQIRSNFLYQAESVFNEPSDTGLSTMFGSFFDAFQELSKNPSSSNTRTVAMQKASTLADAISSSYKKIDDLKLNAQTELQKNVKTVNTILDQINDINKQIRMVSVQGQMPNDLLDRRDNLIDQLSSKFNINVTNGDFNSVDISPVDSTGMVYPNMINADPNNKGARLSYISSVSRADATETPDADGNYTYNMTYYKSGDSTDPKNTVTVNVKMTADQAASLDANRVIWADTNGQLVGADGYPITDDPNNLSTSINFNELMTFVPSQGEISGNISIQADVAGFKDELNQMARALAYAVNSIHSGTTDASKDNKPIFVNSKYATYTGTDQILTSYNAKEAEKTIDASNISINKELLKDPMKLNCNTKPNDDDDTALNTGSGDGKRALAIAQIRDTLLKVQSCDATVTSRDATINGQKFIEFADSNNLSLKADTSGMTISSYYTDIIDKLKVKKEEADRLTTNQKTMTDDFKNSRSGVSGVSIDEEMSNLIAFQHAYSASAKVISTVDELLDVVINGLKK